MSSKPLLRNESIDGVLKSLLVLARTVEEVLETRAVADSVDESLSSSKIQLLRLLGTRGGQTSSQAARFLGVSRPAVTHLIDSMVDAKLVSRGATKRDRREVVLELTKPGRAAFQAVRRTQRHLLRNALRLSDPADAVRWKETMYEIAAAVAQADKAFGQYCLQCGAHTDGTCVLVGGEAECLFLHHGARTSRRAKSRTSAGRSNRKA